MHIKARDDVVIFTRQCKRCGFKYSTRFPGSLVCPDCKDEVKNIRNASLIRQPTSDVGAISELMVSVDLARRGYSVFRALSPIAPCDLVAIKDRITIRVEVKTGQVNLNGTLSYVSDNVKAHLIAVVVFSDNMIHYIDAFSLQEISSLDIAEETHKYHYGKSMKRRNGLKRGGRVVESLQDAKNRPTAASGVRV